MKVNIAIGSENYKSGYVNIDPTLQRKSETVSLENANEEQTNIVKCDIRNIDDIVSNSECKELVAIDVLDFLEWSESRHVLAHWISKLRHGGKITVGGTDILEVCRLFYKQAIDLKTLNSLIHGEFSQAWDVKMGHSTMEDLKTFLESQGIRVTKQRIKGFKMIVEGERP